MRVIYNTVSNHKPESTVNTLTQTECAYLAGMIDADGSISKSKNRRSFICKVRVHNSSEELMIWLKRVVGAGSVECRPPGVDKHGYKHTLNRWTFDISAKVDVTRLLEQIHPYLVIKKDKAKMVMDFIPTMKRPTTYNKRI